jgi:hypothetical protein
MGPIGKTTRPHQLRDPQSHIIILTAGAQPAPANQHIDNTTLSHHRALQYSIEFTEQGEEGRFVQWMIHHLNPEWNISAASPNTSGA